MANFDLSPTRAKEEAIFNEVRKHNEIGFQETDRRATGKNRVGSISFNEADELFRSWIDEKNWPYDALLFDPRTFTFIFEKTSRLISSKPKGHLIPREGSDILAAKINNALLDYQWDAANYGGTMLEKWAMMDMNTRKYGSSFGLVKWRYELDNNGRCVFNGPEMTVLNNRDIAHELSATSIQSCNWFQARQYVTLQDLQQVNDHAGEPIYKNLDKLKGAIGTNPQEGGGGDSRAANWISRNRQIAGLETDPYGQDNVYKNIEIVTEYRKDRWITFAPKHGVVIRDIPNPYDNYQIPIVMLRYYSIDDDLYGLSEIEPIKGPQKAINALLCQYVDEINQNLYSPIAIGPGVRQHTLEWGKGARWIMNNPQTDFRLVESHSQAAQFFQTSYSVIVAAMQNALGESSLGVSNVQPFQNDKTATEVKALQLQRNARDQFNQNFLAEAIKRQMMLWHSMNRKLLFADQDKFAHVIRIVGKDALKWFFDYGLGDEEVLDDEETQQMAEFLTDPKNTNGIGNDVVDSLAKDTFTQKKPKFPVYTGKGEDRKMLRKLQMDQGNKSALLYIEPEDMMGEFDFSVDVESMAVNAEEDKRQGRAQAIQMLTSNPNVTAMLAMDGVKPKFKELFVTYLEDVGFNDADRYFERIDPQEQQGGGGEKPPIESINFKDLPPEGQAQMAAKAGIQIDPSAGGAPGKGAEGAASLGAPNPRVLQSIQGLQ